MGSGKATPLTSSQNDFRFYREEGRIYSVGTRETRTKVTEFHNRFPTIYRDIEPALFRIGKNRGCITLETVLEQTTASLKREDLNLTGDDQDIRDFSEAKAKTCGSLCAEFGMTEKAAELIQDVLNKYGLAFPKGKTLTSKLRRTHDEAWWRRTTRDLQGRVLDETARHFGIVSKKKASYVSDWAYRNHQHKRKRNRDLLEALTAVNEIGQEYTLKELSDLSVSNPSVRRAELITRTAGFEQIAQDFGHAALFYTLTTPSKYHPVRTTGKPNPKYNGATVKDAQKYLTDLWALVRSQLNREGIWTYGFRIVEPHHDGTPHWHLLLFTAPEHKERLTEIFSLYALQEDGNEPGAEDARLKTVEIDYERGSATGYVVKYICKNIDGDFKEDGEQAQDLIGNSAVDAAQRVGAWASIHGIRQFQQQGGPPVTVWRELRRLNTTNDEDVESARRAADNGDWASFTTAMNGPNSARGDQPIKPAYRFEIDWESGELLDEPFNRYGEESDGKLFGLVAKGVYYVTRHHRWEIQDTKNRANPTALGSSKRALERAAERLLDIQEPTQEAVAALPQDTAYRWSWSSAALKRRPWSSVNNCTGRVKCPPPTILNRCC